MNKTRTFYNLQDELNDELYPIVTFVGLGDKDAKFSARDDLHLNRENLRKGLATGIESIKKISSKVKTIILDDCNGAYELIGELVGLISYSYKDYIDLKSVKNKDNLTFHLDKLISIEDKALYKKGLMAANLQNVSRLLSETPSNLSTPTRIAEFANEFAAKNNVQIKILDKEWAKEKRMGAFLAVTQGSCEPCKFIELHYKHPGCEEQKPFILVGKGITFDSGGISLKKASGMDSQRADMTGAACVLSTIIGCAKLQIKGNLYFKTFSFDSFFSLF